MSFKQVGKPVKVKHELFDSIAWHVKTDKPTIIKHLSKPHEFVETKHLAVQSFKEFIKESESWYEETVIIASSKKRDIDLNFIVYKAQRALTLEEAMFSIGHLELEKEDNA